MKLQALLPRASITLFAILFASVNCFGEGFETAETIGVASFYTGDYLPSAASNGNGLAVVAYMSPFGSFIIAEKSGDLSWTLSSNGSLNSSRPPDVAVNPSGAAVVAACDSSSLRIRTRSAAGTWNAVVARTTPNCIRARVAINSSGRAVVVFTRTTDEFTSLPQKISVLMQNGDGSWPTNPIYVADVSNYFVPGPFPDVAIDDSNNVLAAWHYVVQNTPGNSSTSVSIVSTARIANGSSTPSGQSDITNNSSIAAARGLELDANSATGAVVIAFPIDTYNPTPGSTVTSHFIAYQGSISTGSFSQITNDGSPYLSPAPYVRLTASGSTLLGWSIRGAPSASVQGGGVMKILGAGANFEFEAPFGNGYQYHSAPRIVETESGDVYGAYVTKNTVNSALNEGKFLKFDSSGNVTASSTFFSASSSDSPYGANLVAFDTNSALLIYQIEGAVYSQLYRGAAGGGGGGDQCPGDDNKTAPGICGCGTPDADLNADTLIDCGGPRTFVKSLSPLIGSATGAKKSKITLILEKFVGKNLRYVVTLSGPKGFKKTVESKRNKIAITQLKAGKYTITFKVVQEPSKGKVINSKKSAKAVVTL